MPYIIRPKHLRSAAVMAASTLLLGGSPAQAATTQCQAPSLSQPFLYANDTNFYALTPGQTVDNFNATGWVLSGGAKVKKAALADGRSGSVLYLPPGSRAVSPTFCVTREFPIARTMITDLQGGDGLFFDVAYEGTNTWGAPRNTGQVHGNGTEWTTSSQVNMQPENVPGWQHVQITLLATGAVSSFEVYDLYIDPYSR